MKIASDISRTVTGALAIGVAVVSFVSADELTDSFDMPVKTVNVELGPSPSFEDANVRSLLRCHYYLHLMVKEYSEGGPSADLLSMLRRWGELPRCELSRQRGEKVVDEWHGFFKGVKDSLVFFDAGQAFNGDSPFAVFDSVSGKKIFQSSAYAEYEPSLGYDTSRIRVIAAEGNYLLTYTSVAYADCNLHSEGSTCWERIKGEFDLNDHEMPVCTGYDHIAEVIGTDDVESRIAYPVEVSLFPRPTVTVVAGPLKCWPAQ